MIRLPCYEEYKTRIPLPLPQRIFIEESRQTVRSILNGTDPRLLMIVGPCSIHDPLSAKEFAMNIKNLFAKVHSQFFLIMRVYCEKPRTAAGWKGFVYDPLLDGSYNIQLGIEWTRQLLLELAYLEVPAATEFLDPLLAFYYEDLITWGSIGARTASSQIHRQLASDLPMPIGFKNGVAGDISAGINGALAASQSHTYLRLSEKGAPCIQHTLGNPDGHVVLRGGESGPNYDPAIVSATLENLEQVKLPPRILIDCSHHNSGKKHKRQTLVFRSIIHQIIEGNTCIRGLMLESHLQEGSQLLTDSPDHLQYGLSITDDCLDWSSTADLIAWGAEYLNKQYIESEALSKQDRLVTFGQS